MFYLNLYDVYKYISYKRDATNYETQFTLHILTKWANNIIFTIVESFVFNSRMFTYASTIHYRLHVHMSSNLVPLEATTAIIPANLDCLHM